MAWINAARGLHRAAILALGAGILAVAPLAAAAQEREVTVQGDPEGYETTREQLFEALAAAPDETTAREIADSIWNLWFQAPNPDAQHLMELVLERRQMLDLPTALKLLDQLVEEAPDWAEAWNQRATIRFMAGDYEGSLADIDRVLPLEPKHFGALAGEAIILLKLGRKQEAQLVLRQAVEINPFLIERALLDPEPEGKDI
jgi:tetratricopeptide (TPR) repeat protein